jgi:uncharacterized membrane protein YphA (DoxX/SURF4 family)
MDWLRTIIQLVVGLGIYNVWLLRFGKATNWRGGNAKSMREEFAVYGLPSWSVSAVGFLKLLCATALILGVWFPALTRPAGLGLAMLMAGAVAMHVKVKDPIPKSLPALTMLVLSLFIAAT